MGATASAAGALGQAFDEEGRIPFRVRVGVTGHRRLNDAARVRDGISGQLARLRDLYEPTDVTAVTFTLLTALAEGADRLVPEIALQELADGDVEMEAVLPLTVDDYLDDFDGESSRREFTRLLARCTARVELTREQDLTGDARVAAYAAAGRHIVDNSDILIAVWDGAPGRGPGGTADVVRLATERGVPVLVVTAAADASAAPAPPRAVRGARRVRGTAEPMRRIDEYNRGSVTEGRLRAALTATDAERLPAPSPAIAAEIATVRAWALPRYVRADALALRHQSVYSVLAKLIHFLAAFAVAAVAAVVVFAPEQTGWLGIEIGLLMALILVVAVGRRGRVRERWMSYRSLAEAFRSAEFICLAGIPETDHAGGNTAEGAEPWFQRAFSEAWRSCPRLTVRADQAADLRAYILAAWLDDQIAFHERTAARHCRRRAAYTRTVYLLAAVTIVVASLHIAHWPESTAWREAFTFIAITLPGFGAAVTGLREHGQHALHEERSRRTADRLRRLRAQQAGPDDAAGVRALVAETHRVIVEENVGWSGVMEFQDLEMVI